MIRVAQCWDDGVLTDARLTDILRKYNAKATFNLCPGTIGENDTPMSWVPGDCRGWSHRGFQGGRVGRKNLTKVYGGFKVASHCMRHEVSGNLPLADFVSAAADARKFLEDVFGMECPGFAWPCGVFSPETTKALADAGFAYGRTTRNTADVAGYAHPMNLDSSCHFLAADFWSKFDALKKTGGIFYFWGHSYEMMDSEGMWRHFETKIEAISRDPEVEWIDVVDIVR